MLTQLFLSAFISLFVVTDPFGTAAVFTVLTRNADRAEQKRIARKAVLIAGGVLIAFSVVGESILQYMHVSMPAFRVAGGLLLFVTAFRMIMGFHDPDQLSSERSAYRDRSDIAVFPLAIPLLAGPGCMTAVLMFSTAANTAVEYGVVFAVILIVQVVSFSSLMGASFLGRLFGSTGNGIIARVMGILLAAMAVQFIADAVKELLSLM